MRFIGVFQKDSLMKEEIFLIKEALVMPLIALEQKALILLMMSPPYHYNYTPK